MPTNGFIGRPVYGPLRGRLSTLAPATLDLLMSLAATTAVPGRAHVAVVFLDCALDPAPGVTLVAPDELFGDGVVRLFYPLQGDGPTRASGEAALINVPAGCIELSGEIGGEETHRVRLEAFADQLTVTFAPPRSEPHDVGYPCAADFAPPAR